MVGAVEEGEVLFGADGGRDLFPLSLGGVDASGVVGASVEEDDTTFGGGLNGGEHAIEVETLGRGGEVRVRLCGDGDVAEYLIVVRPGWVGEVDGLGGRAGIEFREEQGPKVDGAGARDSLEGFDLV